MTRLVQLCFHIVGEFMLVFEIIVNPCADFLDLGTGQFWNRSFNLLNGAHAGKNTGLSVVCKDAFGTPYFPSSLIRYCNCRVSSQRTPNMSRVALKTRLPNL